VERADHHVALLQDVVRGVDLPRHVQDLSLAALQDDQLRKGPPGSVDVRAELPVIELDLAAHVLGEGDELQAVGAGLTTVVDDAALGVV
jgi:hypothetical protein